MIDEKLLGFASESEVRYLEAVISEGGFRPAARLLDSHHRTVSKVVARVKRKAALRGYAPEAGFTRNLPEPFVMGGISQMVDERTGEPRLTWYKSKVDPKAYKAMLEDAAKGFFETQPKVAAPTGPDNYETDVIPWVMIGDAHLGMLAHAAETGENFDLKIAELELCTAISMLMDEIRPCERLVINDVGDFTHSENFSSTTEASRHPLDSDGRFPKMIKVYSRVMRFIIDKALTKANTVDVIINQGNHSRTNDVWMAELLRVAYGGSNRVNVLNNDSVFIGCWNELM
jgi:hypothetical protein